MALIGLLQRLCLIGCQILDDMCYVGRPIGWLHVRVVSDVAEGSSSRAPPWDPLWSRYTLLCGVTDGSSSRASFCRHGSSTARYRRHSGTQVNQPTACGWHWIFGARRPTSASGRAGRNRRGWRDDFCRCPVQVGALLLCGGVIIRVVEHALAAALGFAGRGRGDRVQFFGSRSSARAGLLTR